MFLWGVEKIWNQLDGGGEQLVPEWIYLELTENCFRGKFRAFMQMAYLKPCHVGKEDDVENLHHPG